MGEIKSTLDLVLEKTKHLTLSSEEKQAQVQKEVENRIKGMLQKYQDGLLTRDDLITEYDSLEKDLSRKNHKLLIDEIFSRVDPNQNNQSLLELLPACCHIDPARVEAVINDFRQNYNSAAQKRSKRLKENLAQKYFISGSAVVPNLEEDEQWRRTEAEMRQRFEDQLSREKDKLVVDCVD